MIIRSKLSFPGAAEVADPWYLAGGAPTPVAAYQPIGAASLAASYTNLVNPGTFDAAPGVAPTWSAVTGWGFNGSTQYLTTGVVPNSNNWTMLVRFSGVTSGAATVIGSYSADGLARFYLQPDYFGTKWYSNGGHAQSRGDGIASGVMAVAGRQPYLNGATDGAANLATGTWTNALPAIIGALNHSGNAVQFFTGNVQSIAIYDTSTDHAVWVPAVSAAMAAL
jgi:hypothetical protein